MMKRVFIGDEFNTDPKYMNINLERDFTHIRAYHGCRPLEINTYYENGIEPITQSYARQLSIDLLCDEKISKDMVNEVFNKNWSEFDQIHRHVWFTSTRKELLEYCGHYLIYGSEFINGVASELHCQEVLKSKGKPTIFHCDVPIGKIHAVFLTSIQNSISEGRFGSGGFKINGGILPHEIVQHEHPLQIKDPLNRFEVYTVM